jgi:4-aminobutyrate aminotransferase-like enzyme/Ser/Thr protein kinase RdoA (MazF antagonist)
MAAKISTDQASKIASELLGVSVNVSELPGYVDANFKITTSDSAYILKLLHPEHSSESVDFQNAVLKHIAAKDLDLQTPAVVQHTKSNDSRHIRLLSWVPGRLWAHVHPKSTKLRISLGEQSGKLTAALADFKHPGTSPDYHWDLVNSNWTSEYVHLFTGKKRSIIIKFQERFQEIKSIYQELPKCIIHNDVNDYNIVVSEDLHDPQVTGIIDFGDATHTQTINDLAVVLAYACMEVPNPVQAAVEVIKGYQKHYPFSERELECLYTMVAMRLVVSVTKSAIKGAEDPSNTYHLISEKPAWDLLEKWYELNEEFALYNFRGACGYNPHPNEKKFTNWATKTTYSFSELFPSIKKEGIQLLDLKVSSTWIGSQTDFNDLDLFQFKIDQLQKTQATKIIAGGYCEARPLYTASAYEREGNNGPENRTVHLGIDFWLPEKTHVHALFDGEVVTSTNNKEFKEYGGLIILKHFENGITFYSLYGHLSIQSVEEQSLGDSIKKGECIGYLGNSKENGVWVPHLHFQLMLSMLDYTKDFPGVTYANEISVWKSLCPDPNLLFKNKDLNTQFDTPDRELIKFREDHLGKGLSLSYDSPLYIVRGEGVYLIDIYGRNYLDTVNNVNHVGHQHPEVVKAAQSQMAVLNTNTRYLHPEIIAYSKALLNKLPEELSVLHFVNSGSEANELALRMAKIVSGQKDFLAIEAGYHGNTNAVIDVSSYKFEGKGGNGKPETTHLLPLPDPYRGKYTGKDCGTKYANHAKDLIDQLRAEGKGIAGFIGESMISCGGQIVPPKNYFKEVYKHVRDAGGVCIADEVQTGFGRMGKAFWAFELFDVIPDIVTMGKPAGNGHPLAVVACTKEVAAHFNTGMEYFNTFGGNPVSCAIGHTVLNIIEKEKLQENALIVGEYLSTELKSLSKEFPIIGDVRGEGLFLGFELTDSHKNPLASHATYLANRMKTLGILMSTDGPDHNVLKIKPPLVFTKENAKELIFRLKSVFSEDFMQSY